MCEHVVIAFKLLTEGNRRIRRIMTTFNNGHDTFQHFLVNSHHSSSNAEQTIQRYSNFDSLPTSRTLAAKLDGINYPQKSL